MKTFTAVHTSRCPECMETIEAEVDEIAKVDDTWMHEQCAEDLLETMAREKARREMLNPFAGADDPVVERYRSRR